MSRIMLTREDFAIWAQQLDRVNRWQMAAIKARPDKHPKISDIYAFQRAMDVYIEKALGA